MVTRAAQTYLLRTQLAPARSLTQDAPFQFLEQFIIRARVCVSAHITRIPLQRGSGFEPGVLSSCGKTTVITLSASRTEHPSRKGRAFLGGRGGMQREHPLLASSSSSAAALLSPSLRLHQAGPNVTRVESRASSERAHFDRSAADIKSDSVGEGGREGGRLKKKKKKKSRFSF